MKIQCKEVSFSYGQKPLFSGLNLNIDSGEQVWIQGPSGTGKSSFLQLIAGLRTTQSGSISVGELNYQDATEAQIRNFRFSNIGYLHQENHLIDHWSVLQNLELSNPNQGANVAELLIELGLKKEILNHPAGTLSGGEKQRASIARVILQRPKVALLD